jgi:thiamine kinase-like enzyme
VKNYGVYGPNNRYSSRADFYERHLGKALDGYQPVFIHTDIQKKNIIVDCVTADEFKVSLVDWESSGWYPSCWEYSGMLEALEWIGDWPL